MSHTGGAKCCFSLEGTRRGERDAAVGVERGRETVARLRACMCAGLFGNVQEHGLRLG